MTRSDEKYLYKIAKRVLQWAEYEDYTEAELWDLIMLELSNIKKEN